MDIVWNPLTHDRETERKSDIPQGTQVQSLGPVD